MIHAIILAINGIPGTGSDPGDYTPSYVFSDARNTQYIATF